MREGGTGKFLANALKIRHSNESEGLALFYVIKRHFDGFHNPVGLAQNLDDHLIMADVLKT